MKKVENNIDEEHLFPKSQMNVTPQWKESVKLLGKRSNKNEKDVRPTYLNDIVAMMLKDLFAKPFPNEENFKYPVLNLCTRPFLWLIFGQLMCFTSNIVWKMNKIYSDPNNNTKFASFSIHYIYVPIIVKYRRSKCSHMIIPQLCPQQKKTKTLLILTVTVTEIINTSLYNLK